MSTVIRASGVATVALLLLFGAAAAAIAQGAPAAATLSPCDSCHDTLTAAFVNNPHARGAKGLDVATCTSCHGDAAKHAESGEKADVSVPANDAGAKVCLSCHRNDSHHEARSGFHSKASVTCSSCHSVHEAKATPLLKQADKALCASCHPGQINLFRKPFTHRLDVGGLTCVSCHNPHGGRGERSLQKTAAGEVACFGCHPDKRGPFVFPHSSSVVGDCQSCHEPHGSNNGKMLIRASVDQLCLECHTTFPAGTLGSQPPSIHDLRTPRYRNCTTCHVAIHGSNSSPMLLK